MVNSEFDEDFPEEDEDIETEDEEAPAPAKPAKLGRPSLRKEVERSPVAPIKKPQAQAQAQSQEPIDEDAYASYHIPERNGILDKKSNKIVGEDMLSILAVMLNKIEKIERAIG